nr:hypothetical protein [uncultured Albidiferax sp.]
MLSLRAQYKVMRGSGLAPFGAIWFAVLMAVAWPFVVLADWATPHREGFGKFKREDDADGSQAAPLVTTTVMPDLSSEESERAWEATMRAEGDYAFNTPLPADPAEAWWLQEMRLLRILEAKVSRAAAIVRRRSEADERRLNWLIGIYLGGMLVCLAVAVYAMKYLR